MNRGGPKGRRGFGDGGIRRFSPEVGRVRKGGCDWEDTGPAS
jgi:hypothetical protein